jgi:hypothetical protein
MRELPCESGMTIKQKLTFVTAGTALALLFAILVAGAISFNGSGVYYERGRCSCGHPIFIRIAGDGYFSFSPGHGVAEHREYNLRRNNGGWDKLALPPPDGFESVIKEGSIVGRVRLENGALYETWGTNWVRCPRVYNNWRLHIAKLLTP